MAISKLSIVIPCYNEAGNLKRLISDILESIEENTFNLEIIVIDDGSKDNTYHILKELSKTNKAIQGYSLSRNFGHQIALFAGLEKATGDAILTMDADLQHPPEIIPLLIEKYNEGYDIVNTKRAYDPSTSRFKKLSSKWFYIFMNKISDVYIEPDSSDFRIMSRESLNALLKLREQDRFTRGLIQWIGFNQTIVPYTTNKRFAGTSSYTLAKMIKFAISGVTSMSSKPLRLSLYLGMIFVFIGLLYGCYVLYKYFLGVTFPGWTSILISVLLIGGIQLLILSIIGEYVAKIFNEAKSRPLYFIKASTKDN